MSTLEQIELKWPLLSQDTRVRCLTNLGSCFRPHGHPEHQRTSPAKRRGPLEGLEAACHVGDGGGGEGGGVWAAEDLWRRHDTLLVKNIFS